MNNRDGHTLAELMIYMVLSVVVLGYSFQAMQHMAESYVYGREVTKMQSSGRDAINFIARDIANTGFKYFLKKDTILNTAGDGDSIIFERFPTFTSDDSLYLFGSYTSSYIDTAHVGSLPQDSSASFFAYDGNPSDTLEIFRAMLATVDSIGFVERSKYYLNNDTLIRVNQKFTNRSLVGGKIDWGTSDTDYVIAGCKSLQFRYSRNGYSWVDDPTTLGIRDSIQHIKVQIAIHSDRTGKIGVTGDSIALGNINIKKDSIHLYRVYTQNITIPNNGVLY